MSALPDGLPEPDKETSAADTAATDQASTAPTAGASNLYVIPRPEPESSDSEDPGLVSRMLGELTPPAFWGQATPSAAEEINRARHGQHLQASGPLRAASIGAAWVAAGFTVRDQFKIWLRAHPARLVTAGILLGLLLVSPARPMVAWLLFGWQHLAFDALTD